MFKSKNATLCLALALGLAGRVAAATPLWSAGVNVIPSPAECTLNAGDFLVSGTVNIVVPATAGDGILFTARDLAGRLKSDFAVEAAVGAERGERNILLSSGGKDWKTGQGYRLQVNSGEISIEGDGDAGLFYGTRTLLQLLQPGTGGIVVKGVAISDKPDIPIRGVHYDTKHHQDRLEYLRGFIRDLADYKVNMLIWEWEDKFAYTSHPEVGAPGAFTAAEIRELAAFARDYHIQIVPLIQGLGHVSYILKWEQNAHLREIPASNWEFCPLKDGAYELLFDLWREAIEATPGSEYLHIGSDETFELGRGPDCACAEHVDKLGRYSFYMQFVNRCAEYIVKQGRKFIAWTPEYMPDAEIKPLKNGPLLGEALNVEMARRGVEDGYTHWVYTPNPGLEEPFLPYFYRENNRNPESTLEEAYNTLTVAAGTGLYEGMIVASWDDSGLHNQAWMMRFVNAAEYGWSGDAPELDEFIDKYFTNYYGPKATEIRELFTLLNKASYYFMDSFERKVWHWGEIGKTHIPDLPRGDAIEYDPFWNTEYAAMVERSRTELDNMQRALEICRRNLDAGVRHSYDMELFVSIAELIAHNARTYLALSELEKTITRAHKARFVSHEQALAGLNDAAAIVERNLADREKTYNDLVAVWEKSRLPKGMSTADKKYFHRQDRARHFANRRADMSYLICDEHLLGLEGYLADLREYAAWYRATFIK